MPSLDTLLKETMLGKASPTPNWQYAWSPLPITEPRPAPDFDQSDIYEKNPIWRYDNPIFSGAGVQVTNLKCKVRSMGYMQMQVLDLIEWGPVTFNRADGSGSVSLPLTEQFLARSRYVKEGSIGYARSGYWQLPANIDQSFEMVFGYELPFAGSPSPAPLSFEDLSSDQFMDAAAVFHTDPGNPAVATLRTPPFHIIVVVSLVCCKERFDFVPGDILGAGRIYPLIMILTNSTVSQVAGSVKLARPSHTTHTQILGEQMTPTIASAFFADRNYAGGPGRPYWKYIFQYYYIDPLAGKYTMVTPSDRGTEQTIADVVTVHKTSLVLDREETYDRDVRKTAGQGEFDNLHMAPKMVFPQDVIQEEVNRGLSGLETITMAPFCIHDCFHMHVRWSNDFDDPFNMGWVGQMPYAKAGAPLVPGNQGVSLELLSPVSFRYTATAEKPEPFQWQIIMHHGGAYALSVSPLGVAARSAIELLIPFEQSIYKANHYPWTNFYWWLRFDRASNGKQMERLTWTQANFLKMRGVAAAGAAAP